jgi:hypothetical protein
MNKHGEKMGGVILPDMMRWLWRDHEFSQVVAIGLELRKRQRELQIVPRLRRRARNYAT